MRKNIVQLPSRVKTVAYDDVDMMMIMMMMVVMMMHGDDDDNGNDDDDGDGDHEDDDDDQQTSAVASWGECHSRLACSALYKLPLGLFGPIQSDAPVFGFPLFVPPKHIVVAEQVSWPRIGSRFSSRQSTSWSQSRSRLK